MEPQNTDNNPLPHNPDTPGYASMQFATQSSQNQQQQSLPHHPITSFTIIKRIGITIFAIICILGVWETIFPTKPATISTSPSPSSIPNKPVSWKIYSNTKFHYSIKYPDNLALIQETPYSTVFQIKNSQQLVFPSLYISVIPDGYNNTDNIYNYMLPNIINSFFILPDKKNQLIQPSQDPQYWTYTKLATISIANKDAVVIQNNNVWQSQNGEINRRVILKANGSTYIIGTYYTNQQGLNEYHDFLYSFTLL